MQEVFRRVPEDPPPITCEEFNSLMVMIMTMDWKLDQIMKELGIEDGEEEED